jgi:hypothetical protein
MPIGLHVETTIMSSCFCSEGNTFQDRKDFEQPRIPAAQHTRKDLYAGLVDDATHSAGERHYSYALAPSAHR